VSDDLSGFSMIDLFRSEVEGQAVLLSAGLLALETTDVEPETLEALMRAAHSVKGAARIVGLDAAVRVAHALEDCFVSAQRGQIRILPGHVDVLLRGVDMLSRVSLAPEAESEAWQAGNEPDIVAVIADLALIHAGGMPDAPPVSSLPEISPEPDTSSAETIVLPEISPDSVTPSAETIAVPGANGLPALPESPHPLPSPPPDPATAAQPPERVVRVAADSLTHLMGLAGESLVEARRLRPFVDSMLALKRGQTALCESLQALENRLFAEQDSAMGRDLTALSSASEEAIRCRQMLNDKLEEFEDFARRIEDLSGRLHHEVIASRVRPLSEGVRSFPRLVRDVSRQLGKKVQFEVRGGKTGVDRDILEKLESPLTHLIRNALDHGIEAPERRVAAGKPETGTIRLEARHRAGRLLITLCDDGRGIDPERLRARVIERGLADVAMAEQLSEPELQEFLFLPGFTTKEEVTDLSGRGVGLDVVQSMVQAVGGTVRVSSQLAKETCFTLHLPITMSVIRALLVRIGGEPYAFPLARIDRILVIPRSDLRALEGRQHFVLDDQPIGLVAATQVLELPPADVQVEDLAVVVVSDRGHRFGVVVDGFMGERDVQVRPLDARLGKVPNISSASVLEDGWPVLIVDVEDLIRSIDNMLHGRRLQGLPAADRAARAGARKRILVVDDSITVRELERQLLEAQGYAVDTAVDGMDGWNAARGGHYQLVVSDVDMPRMDGIELVRRIKADASLNAIPVVIISYKDREEDRMRGLDAGANSYLTKSSFHDQTFLRTVVDLIGEAHG